MSATIKLPVSAPPANSPYLTIVEAAEYSRLSGDTIRRMLSAGRLTAHRPVRGRVLILRTELDSLIRSSTATPRTGRGRRR